jgi:hypothetical protein
MAARTDSLTDGSGGEVKRCGQRTISPMKTRLLTSSVWAVVPVSGWDQARTISERRKGRVAAMEKTRLERMSLRLARRAGPRQRRVGLTLVNHNEAALGRWHHHI